MAIEERQTNSVVRVPAEPEIAGAQVIGQEALAELEDPVVLAALAGLAVRGVRVAPAELVVRVVELALAIVPAVVPELAIVQVEELVLAIVPVVAEPALLTDPAEVQALLIVPVVAAELAIARPHGRLAVLAKAKWAIGARPRGLLPLLVAEEDLAAVVVETTREPAATEAAKAWAAAV